jgi:hypothetical protein
VRERVPTMNALLTYMELFASASQVLVRVQMMRFPYSQVPNDSAKPSRDCSLS